jgi:hypothetical protein
MITYGLGFIWMTLTSQHCNLTNTFMRIKMWMPLPLEAARPTAIEQPAWRNSGTYSDRLPDRAGALKNNQTAASSRSETHPPCSACAVN